MQSARLMGSWVLALFLAVMFLWIADLSLFPPSEAKNVVFPLLAEESGIIYWEPTGRYVVGLAQVLTALLMIIPWTRRLGAVLGFLIGAGAVVAHVLWLGIAVPVQQGSEATDGGQLFYLAIALAIASLMLAVLHPGGGGGYRGGLGYYGR
jgi:apolipoprotein N-acyltransferase